MKGVSWFFWMGFVFVAFLSGFMLGIVTADRANEVRSTYAAGSAGR